MNSITINGCQYTYLFDQIFAAEFLEASEELKSQGIRPGMRPDFHSQNIEHFLRTAKLVSASDQKGRKFNQRETSDMYDHAMPMPVGSSFQTTHLGASISIGDVTLTWRSLTDSEKTGLRHLLGNIDAYFDALKDWRTRLEQDISSMTVLVTRAYGEGSSATSLADEFGSIAAELAIEYSALTIIDVRRAAGQLLA